MSKEQQLQKSISHLNRALLQLFQIDNPTIAEAKSSIKNAIKKIEKVRERRNSPDFSNEWDNHIESGMAALAHSPMSTQAQMKSLKELNRMIELEEQKLKDVEDSQGNTNNNSNQLLSE
jgi:hypothetical protein